MRGLKKRVPALFMAALIFVLSIPIYAATLPAAEVKDGNTYIGTFMMADQSDYYKKFWDDWKHSNRNVMVAGDNGSWYWFFTVPDGADLTIEDFYNNFLDVRCDDDAMDYLKFSSSAGDLNYIDCTEMGTLSAGTRINGARYVVTGTYFLIDFDGILYLVDDIDGEMEQDKDEDSGFLAWLKKIWDWLTSFWERLKDLLLSLFVPRKGFFDDWFAELRAAFEKKLGGLGAVVKAVKNTFDNISSKDFRLTVSLKPNSLFKGFPGCSINLMYYAQPFLKILRPILTGLVLIITAVICYKRLAAFTRT